MRPALFAKQEGANHKFSKPFRTDNCCRGAAINHGPVHDEIRLSWNTDLDDYQQYILGRYKTHNYITSTYLS